MFKLGDDAVCDLFVDVWFHVVSSCCGFAQSTRARAKHDDQTAVGRAAVTGRLRQRGIPKVPQRGTREDNLGRLVDALDGTNVREASEPTSEAQAVGDIHRRKAGRSTRKKPEAKADDERRLF